MYESVISRPLSFVSKQRPATASQQLIGQLCANRRRVIGWPSQIAAHHTAIARTDQAGERQRRAGKLRVGADRHLAAAADPRKKGALSRGGYAGGRVVEHS